MKVQGNMVKICARVTSTYMEFTLANWNLKIHFSMLLNTYSLSIAIEHLFVNYFLQELSNLNIGPYVK